MQGSLGHVILGLSAHNLEAVRAHELVHVRQYERWGALFVPAYLASSLWHCPRGGCAYRDNRFEREAYAAAPACLLPAPGNDRAKVE